MIYLDIDIVQAAIADIIEKDHGFSNLPIPSIQGLWRTGSARFFSRDGN